MTLNLPHELESAVHLQASRQSLSAERYLHQLLEHDLAASLAPNANAPFKTSYGVLAKYGPAPTEEEVAKNRREMFRAWGKEF